MVFVYDLIFFLGFLLYIPYAVWRGKWHQGFKQRLGFFSTEVKNRLQKSGAIWIHAVSVGEVQVIYGLWERMAREKSALPVVLSTVTPTGYQLARKKFPPPVTVIYAPLDLSFVVRQFVRLIQPGIYITAETEIWPNLFRTLHLEQIPICVVNGRISPRAFARYRRIRRFLSPVIRDVKAFCMQTETDAQRITELGALPERVHVVGNMKFDDLSNEQNGKELNLPFDPAQAVWVAGSTHPGEEEIVLSIYLKLRKDFSALRLVLVPRHVDRSAEIQSLVRAPGLRPVVFSEILQGCSQLLTQDEVLVVDTIGHLRGIYSRATLVFIGKSLTAHGGQNPIEPAYFAKPILVGPHMENFESITRAFLERGSILQVQDPQQLEARVRELLRDHQLRERLGQSARAVIEKHRGATSQCLAVVLAFLNK